MENVSEETNIISWLLFRIIWWSYWRNAL